MSVANAPLHTAKLRRSGTKRLLISHVAPTELELICWRKSYQHVAPNGASVLQHELLTESDGVLIARRKLRRHAERGAQFAAGPNRLNSSFLLERALIVIVGQTPTRLDT